jgi:hypothetical protein
VGGRGPLASRIILAVEDEPRHRKDAQEPAVYEIDPLDLIETIREGVLNPDLTVRFAHCSFGDKFTVTPKDTPRDKGGPQ